MTSFYEKLPNRRKAELNRENFYRWKKNSLGNFGFFPIFQPLKESFILKNLPGNALRLYLYLGLMSDNNTGETWVSVETIATYFGKSKRTISDWLKELEKAKLIERMQFKPNEVSHTFLKPYGLSYLNDENSLQKGINNSNKQDID